MGTEKPLMEHLARVYDALEDGKTPDVDVGPTRGEFIRGTPNHKLLAAAVGYVDAVLLRAPGTDPAKARSLVERFFAAQEEVGHGAFARANEILTPSHAQLWWAGMAAIYHAAVTAGDAAIEPLARRWWRAEAALCHLCGWIDPKDKKRFKVVSPGARGATPQKPKLTTNPARDVGYHILVTGAPPIPETRIQVWRDRYNVGPRLLLRLLRDGKLGDLRRPGAGEPLPGPDSIRIWSREDLPALVNPLRVARRGADFVAAFEDLTALEPQWAAGVTNGEPWFLSWDGKPETKNGGPCPFPIPRLDNPDHGVEVGSSPGASKSSEEVAAGDSMTDEELRRRRQELDRQLEAGIALLRDAHRAQVQALEQLRKT